MDAHSGIYSVNTSYSVSISLFLDVSIERHLSKDKDKNSLFEDKDKTYFDTGLWAETSIKSEIERLLKDYIL